MNFFFLDASAGVKRYIIEDGTSLINYLFTNISLENMSCLLEGVGEIISVIVRLTNRRDITTEDSNQIKQLLYEEIIRRDEIRLILPTVDQIKTSWECIERHSINSTDAILLQCALDRTNELRIHGDTLVLVSSDKRLLRAAKNEGLLTFDPETDSQSTLEWLINVP